MMSTMIVFSFKIVEELGHGRTRVAALKRMPIVKTMDLIDVVLAVIRSNKKLSTLNRANVSKVVHGDIDILECLDMPFEDCVGCEHKSSSFENKLILITINASLSTDLVPVANAFTVMMANSNNIEFLEEKVIKFPYLPGEVKEDLVNEEDLDDVFHSQTIQEQIKYLLRAICFRIGLGYRESAEKDVLVTFINSYSNVLCFVLKHWKSLLKKDFPNLVKDNQKSMSLQLLTLVSSANR